MSTATINGGAEVATEVAEEEEFNHKLSSKGNLAWSLGMACLAGVLLCSEVGPVLAACSAGLAAAASFGWAVLLGGVPPECDEP